MFTTFADDAAALDAFSTLLNAMSNPKRLHVLSLLSTREISVGALALKVDLSQSALSQHLSRLRGADLVTTRRDSRTVFYSCKSTAVQEILKTLEEIRAGRGPQKAA